MTSTPLPSEDPGRQRWRVQAWSTGACLVATLAAWLLPFVGLAGTATVAVAAAYVAGGWESLLRAARALTRFELDVDLLMLLAAGGAAVVDHALEGAVLLFLFSLGNTLETYAFGRTRRSIQALMELRPETASRLRDGSEEVVRLEELRPGDLVRVRPGERIPVDGEVREGASHVDESTLTGESVPVGKAPGTFVFAGTLNGGGSLDVVVSKPASETQLARVIRLVEEARDAKAPTQGWIERLESRYAAGVILASGGFVLLLWLGLGWTFDDAFYRAMTLLVVASPCALVISIPATVVSAVSNGARHGILFKGGAHLDALSAVRVFAFDKTGTLTMGRPEVVGVRVRQASEVAAHAGSGAVGPDLADAGADALEGDDLEEDQLVRLATVAEVRSEHPLAAALLREAARRGLTVPEPEAFHSYAGRGVEARTEGRTVRVGRRSWIEEAAGAEVPAELLTFLDEHPGATPVYVAVDGRHAGALAIADTPRPGADELVSALRARGIEQSVMLTGDARSTAAAVAERLGLDDYRAELLPHEKSTAVRELRERWGAVAMVGDGVNDAPALAAADLGIAVGAAGSDVALETADVVVMGEDLRTLSHAVGLSRRTRRIVLQNLTFAVSVIVVLVTLALLGRISLTTGVLGHEGSTILVVFNGLRLLRHRSSTSDRGRTGDAGEGSRQAGGGPNRTPRVSPTSRAR